ncbi:MAG: glycoside hydrolase family 99-like domain-containing protein [Oscillospiraceae bacterium]|nr:glycoside hydrolase family 99-like domain-containing protein [Oscillospiraceae bacterium]
MKNNYVINDLDKYDSIIVYGAGIVGIRTLLLLRSLGIKREKIKVWDRSYKNIHILLDYDVIKPEFMKPKKDKKTLVIIALLSNIHSQDAKDMHEKFLSVGYDNIIFAEKFLNINMSTEMCSASTFKDDEYEDFMYEDNIDFSNYSSKIKPIAFYLPQFHEIPENSEWWGEGFTEWTNTKKAKPNFPGHYQPREPHDSIGYYDLSDVYAIRKQVKIAKQHGIYGWGIYYYWFSGKKVLIKPIDIILENNDIDIKYFLVWCNDAWSKRWIGDESQVLIDNEYNDDDPIHFIDDLKKYIKDKRYIHLDDKPIIMIYQIHRIPNLRKLVKKWRDRAIEIGIGEIAIITTTVILTQNEMGVSDLFDGEADFCPVFMTPKGIKLTDEDNNIVSDRMCYYSNFSDNYKKSIDNRTPNSYYSLVCGFDNTPRYGKKASIFSLGFTRKHFYDMARWVVEISEKNNREFFFIFAWNEWAESAYLEPDKKYGYALINTFSKALYNLPLDYNDKERDL